jgi:hypothetical protein
MGLLIYPWFEYNLIYRIGLEAGVDTLDESVTFLETSQISEESTDEASLLEGAPQEETLNQAFIYKAKANYFALNLGSNFLSKLYTGLKIKVVPSFEFKILDTGSDILHASKWSSMQYMGWAQYVEQLTPSWIVILMI